MGLLGKYISKKTGGKFGNKGDGGGEDTPKTTGLYKDALDSYHKGGIVKKTGPAMLKKGERVLTKKQQRKRDRGK